LVAAVNLASFSNISGVMLYRVSFLLKEKEKRALIHIDTTLAGAAEWSEQ
jgi:hypothetical protein